VSCVDTFVSGFSQVVGGPALSWSQRSSSNGFEFPTAFNRVRSGRAGPAQGVWRVHLEVSQARVELGPNRGRFSWVR
jgi:hypothetical protein